jgi:hypothetical protein
MSDLLAYYEETVVVAYEEYCSRSKDCVAGRSRDLRAALTAAAALFNLREHLPDPAPKRGDIGALCRDYHLVADVTNAAKHRDVKRRTPIGAPLVKTADDIYEEIAFIEYEDAQGTFQYRVKRVTIRLTDGSTRDLLEVLTTVVNFWESYLFDLGVLKRTRTFKYEDPIRLRSRQECEGNFLDFELVRGERLQWVGSMFRVNKETGKLEAIQLKPKPTYEIELFLEEAETGARISRCIPLSTEQIAALECAPSDVERVAILTAVSSVQSALREIALEADSSAAIALGNDGALPPIQYCVRARGSQQPNFATNGHVRVLESERLR